LRKARLALIGPAVRPLKLWSVMLRASISVFEDGTMFEGEPGGDWRLTERRQYSSGRKGCSPFPCGIGRRIPLV